MEKEFVPYELALKLKPLGFDKPCFGWYQSGRLKKEYIPLKDSGNQSYMRKEDCNAPTFSQCFRWFREEYNLLLDIVAYYGESQLPLTYNNKQKPKGYFVWDLYDENFNEDKALKFKTYEEAELECLKKLIEIVKEK